jgi:S-adenosylmethionine-dependent methyltransferase
MSKENTKSDRNFDDLAHRFKKNIYGGLKGDIRLAVLMRDCNAHLAITPFVSFSKKQWRILDVGGGQGQFSLPLAQAGHELVICDLSADMLALAQERANLSAIADDKVKFIHASIQTLEKYLSADDQHFDFVVCHSVMEWMAEPKTLLPLLLRHLKPEGFLSFSFYNRDSLIFKNLLRTNFNKIIHEDYAGSAGSLTPINPMDPNQVMSWVQELPLTVLAHSGIRVFHDYIFNQEHRERDPENLLKLELQFSQQEPYRSLGRYIHLLMQLTPSSLTLT